MKTSNRDESYRYDGTANPPLIIQEDTPSTDPSFGGDSYADVVKVSDNLDSDLSRLSEIQYDKYDSLDACAVTYINNGEHPTKNDSSRPAVSNVHAYDNNNGMYSSRVDKCIPQYENVTLDQIESSIDGQDYLELIDGPNYDLTDLNTKKRPL